MKQRFTIHTPNLLKEIVECALPKGSGILFVPVNQFRERLVELADIARETQEPNLMLWCFDMTLFEEADPHSKFYKPSMRKKILKDVKKR